MVNRSIFFLLSVSAAFGAAAPQSDVTVLGGAAGQTLRVTIAASSTSACAAFLRIQTIDQSLVRPDSKHDLSAGQTAVVDLPLSTRMELLPYVRVLAGNCRASVELYESSSGRTTSLVPMLTQGVERTEKGLEFTPSGASRSQILRLAITRGFDPQPDPPACRVELAFTDARGNIVGPTKSVDLSIGQIETLDLNPNLLLPATPALLLPARIVAQPRLLLPAAGGGDIRGCDGSVRVIDQASGWSTATIRTR